MKAYILLRQSDGSERLIEAEHGVLIPVNPGDDIVVVDENGRPAESKMRPEGQDLILTFENGNEVILDEFYVTGPDLDPITIGVGSAQEIAGEAEYEFNSQVGNLPEGVNNGFTLMRYSNTEFIDFDEQVLPLRDFLVEPFASPSGFSTSQPADEPPVANPDFATTTEDESVRLNLIENDIDPEGGRLVVSLIEGTAVLPGQTVTLPSGATVRLLDDGNVEFTPSPDAQALATGEQTIEEFIYSITDEGGNVVSSVATVSVLGVNDPPEPQADGFTIEENEIITANILANDSDPDRGDTITLTEVENPGIGQLSFTPDGEITFDPEDNYDFLSVGESATLTVSYTVTDDHGATGKSTVTFTITGVNEPPVADPDYASTSEGDPVNIPVLGNDSDVDQSDTLSVCGIVVGGIMMTPLVGQPLTLDSGATVTLLSDGTIDYQPASGANALDAGESATDVFTYKIDDGNGGTATSSVTVTLLGEDDPSELNPDYAVTDEDTPVSIDVLANDSDPDTSDNPLVLNAIPSPPAKGDVTIVGGEALFDPDGDFEDLAVGESETVTFTYSAETPDGDTVIETVTVTVNGVNDDPLANPDTGSTTETTPVTIRPLDNDTDPDASDDLSICGIVVGGTMVTPIVGQPLTLDSGAIVVLNNNGEFDYTPAPGANALDEGESLVDVFTYKIDDGNGGTATSTVSVTILGEDDPTTPAPDADVTDEDSPVTIDVLANDTDPDISDTLTVSDLPTQPGKGIATIVGNEVVFDPNGEFDDLAVGETETVTFTYEASTPDGDTVTETVTVTITGVNDPPVADDENATTSEDVPVTIDVVDGDTDIDGTVVPGSVVFVNPPAGSTLSGDQKTLTVPGEGEYVANPITGEVTFTPEPNYIGSVTPVEYSIADNDGATDIGLISITLNDVNDPPVADDDSATTDEDTPVTIDVLDGDVDIDGTLVLASVVIVNPPAGSTLAPDGKTLTVPGEGQYVVDPGTGDITFTPEPNYNGAVTPIEYSVADDDGATDIGQVTITINDVNDPPVADDESATTDEDVPVTIDVVDGDTDIDGSVVPASVVFVNPPAGATLGGNQRDLTVPGEGQYSINPITGVVTFTPEPNYAGSVTPVEYSIADNDGATDIGQITITLNPVNDAPEANDDSATTDENTPVDLNVPANDTDLDGTIDPTSVTFVNPPAGATISPDGKTITVTGEGVYVANPTTGVVTFTPENGYTGNPTSVDYSIADDGGATDTASITISITPNTPPTANDDNGTTPNDTDITLNLLNNDSDPDGTLDPTSVQLQPLAGATLAPDGRTLTIPGEGVYTINPTTGQATFDPDPAFDGNVTPVTYSVADDDGATAIATINVTVDAPIGATEAVDDLFVIDEGETLNVPLMDSILGNDSDPENDPLTVNTTPVSNVSNGTLTLNADGTFDYVPDSGFMGTDSFVYEINDGNGNTATATVTIRIDNDRDGYDNATDLDDDNDGILDEDECVTPVASDSGVDGSLEAGSGTATFDITSSNGGAQGGEHILNSFTISGWNPTVDGTYSDFIVPDSVDVAFSSTNDSVDEVHTTGSGTVNLLADGEAAYEAGVIDAFQSRDLNHFQALDGHSDTFNNDHYDLFYDTPVISSAGGFVFLSERNGNNRYNLEAFDSAGNSLGTIAHDTTDYTNTGVISNTGNQPVMAGIYAIDDLAPVGSEISRIRVTFNEGGVDGPDGKIFLVADQALVQEECDHDDDGTPNRLEVDSDNGGINDVVESGNGGLDGDGDGRIDGPVDGNGVPVAANGGADPSSFPDDPYDPVDDSGAPNGAPTATDDTAETCEDLAVEIDVTENDTDPENDTLQITEINGSAIVVGGSVTLGSGAVVTLGADGNLDYDPNSAFTLQPGASTTDSFVYTVSDGNGGTDTATANVTINSEFAVARWEDNFSSNGDPILGQPFTVAGVEITVDTIDPDGNAGPNNGTLFSGSLGDVSGNAIFFLDGDTAADFTTNTINFDQEVEGLSFSVLDIDESQFEDKVIIRAYDASNNLVTLNTNFDPSFVAVDTDGGFYGINDLVDGDSSDGNVDVEATGPVQRIELIYSYGPNVESPINQGIGVSDLVFLHANCDGSTPPVVIDLDGDGVEFSSLENGIAFDVDGDGELERTAWADGDDAVLIFDSNDNNQVDDRSEFVFADYSDNPNATDMEGLREAFDTNQDGILSADDNNFDQFKVWQDADGDGVVDEGEMRTLSEAGIESIGLISDGESYSTAEGDVFVHGESEVTFSDGSTGIAADAEFSFADQTYLNDGALEIVTAEGDVIDLNSGALVGPVNESLLISDPESGEAVVIDPGEGGAPELPPIEEESGSIF